MTEEEAFWEWFDRRQEGIKALKAKLDRARANGAPASHIKSIEKRIAKKRTAINNRALRDGFLDIWILIDPIL